MKRLLSANIEMIRFHLRRAELRCTRLLLADTYHLPHHEMLDSNCDYFVYSDSSIQGHDYLSQRSIPASVASASSTVQARTLKTMAPDLFQDYRFVVWIDANVLIRGELEKYIEVARQGEFPLYGIPHPMRNCAYEEAKAVIEAGKADRSAVEAQMQRYRLEGYPPKNGLIETNFLILDMQHPSTRSVSLMVGGKKCERGLTVIN